MHLQDTLVKTPEKGIRYRLTYTRAFEKGGKQMLKVLIVDDETLVRKGILMEVDWKALDCTVVGEAANGLEGLEIASRLAPDLIISDIRMPKMDGIEMVRRLREEGSNVAVIFLTAYSDFAYAQNAIRLFAADYLLKPFEDGELEKAVTKVREQLLDRSEAKAERPKNDIYEIIMANSPSTYVAEAADYILKNCNNPDLSVGMIAEAIGLSEGHLSRTFKQETKMTVAQYITAFRMGEARALLSDQRNKVYEVAALCGYRDINYFTTTFKKHIGITPSEFQGK